MSDSLKISQAYIFCQKMAYEHYENFPVASRLLPKALRKPVSVIYAFARTADDFADEGDASAETRLSQLNDYEQFLLNAADERPNEDPVFIALADVIKNDPLLVQSLQDLLIAFRSDVTTKRYQTATQLLQYCRYSANPVGRMILQLSGHASNQNLLYSDAICSALQLINFLQDINIDYQDKQRLYIPQDELRDFSVSELDIAQGQNSQQLTQLVNHQIDRAHSMLITGKPLGRVLPGRLGLEIRITVSAGLQVIKALRQRNDIFSQPRLRWYDWLVIASRAIFT